MVSKRMGWRQRAAWACGGLLVLGLAGCGSDESPTSTAAASDAAAADGASADVDSGADVASTDATAPDAGPADAGPADAGPADAGPADAGPADAGTADAGTADAGTADAGSADAGTVDAGTADAGTPDTGVVDAGVADAGIADAGVADAGIADAGAADAGVADAGAADAGVSDGGTTDTASADAGTSQGPPIADGTALKWLQLKAYLAWQGESKVHKSTGPHEFTRTYVNTVLQKSLSAGAKSHPVGSVAVKELFSSATVPMKGWAIMVKTQSKGWTFYESLTLDGSGTVYDNPSFCGGCHKGSKSDNFLSPWPLQ